MKSKFGENLTKILGTLHESCLLLPATLNRHDSALFESLGTASQDSRGGINITQKRQNIMIYVYYISCCIHMQSSHKQIRLSQDCLEYCKETESASQCMPHLEMDSPPILL